MPKAKVRLEKDGLPKYVNPMSGVLDDFADFPNVAVLERRLEHPDDPGSQPIYLKDDPRPACDELAHAWRAMSKTLCPVCKVPFRKWKIRTINAGMPNRLHSITHHKGYVKVMLDELADREQLADLASTTDQTVRRGENGKLVVVNMPFKAYALIKRKEYEQRKSREQSASAIKSDLADQAGQSLGDEAGETIHRKFVGTVEASRSTIQDEMTRPMDD